MFSREDMASCIFIKLLVIICIFKITVSTDDYDEHLSHYEGWMDPITLGSIMKLQHQNSGFLLHSHEISWGSGSQQQSVTAYPTQGDGNSMWQIYARYGESNFTHAAAIKCGSVVRFKHVKTGRWLHSHNNHRAPLSHKQVKYQIFNPCTNYNSFHIMY